MLKRKKKFKLMLAITIAALLTVIYLLANRYLIEHVEATLPPQKSQDSNTDTASAVEPSNIILSDDWNYKSDKVDISIEKVQTGTGKNMITYFVADVKLKDSSNLLSAFAKNKFGRNIIEETSKIAEENNAIFAINGDYYGFRNDGILIRNGELYRNVPVRTGAALFNDGTLKTFDETSVSAYELLNMGVLHTLSFGPVLVKNSVAVEDFGRVSVDTNFGNRSIQASNPRTGIGMISANHYVFVVVDGRMDNYSKGMTLPEFADLFADLGCTEAYNLDGGGSSTMYFMGRVVNNPLGKQDERAISDILYVKE